MTSKSALVALLALAAACQSGRSGYERASTTSRRIAAYRDNAERLGAGIGLTLGSLETLAQSPDVAPRSSAETFQTFERELANLEDLAAASRKLYGKMDARAQEFFGKWIEESATIENAELGKRADERREAVQASYKKIGAARLPAEQSLSRLLADLGDLRTYLEQDLTAPGLASAKDPIEKASQEGARVRELLSEIVRAADAAREALAPMEAQASVVEGKPR